MDTTCVPTSTADHHADPSDRDDQNDQDDREDEPSRTGRKLAIFAPLIPLLALVVFWLSGGLGRFDSPEKVAHALGGLRDSPQALLYVLLAFAGGSLFFVPITALIAGSMLALDPFQGVAYAFLGMQLAAAATYWCGRGLGARALDFLSGARVRRFRRLLREHAVRASAAARLLPIGNFTLLNWLIGGMKVPFRWFILGNALGSLPGLIVFAAFADRIGSVLRNPQPQQIALLVGVGVGALLLVYLAQRLAKRLMP